ncbi:hypothetical protein [Microcoleus sp. N9_A1]|uniref:hypothetical protein n=1 Tax=Microcoleus sp. N9_A1 TaxID=3055380 RepID=UPI002FD5621A
MEDLNIDSEEKPDLEQGARELANLKSMQIFLDGYEVHALIVATQLLQVSPQAKDLGLATKAALLAGRKLQRLFLASPHSYALLERGWDLMKPECDQSTVDN